LTLPALCARAPGKVNLCLFLGPRRSDGRHDLVSAVQSVSLADEVRLEEAGAGVGADEVVCPEVDAPNLALSALEAFRRATGWRSPPLRIAIDKRLPVAGGMGGGSADAAAVLRMARHGSGLGDEHVLRDIAAGLGSDVPAALEPGRTLVTGAGERVARIAPPPAGMAMVVIPSPAQLSTGEVFAQADRLALPRSRQDLQRRLDAVTTALGAGELPVDLMVNDLARAARSLLPEIDGALGDVRAAGADHAVVSGSGPTVVGLFLGDDAPERAMAAAGALGRQHRRAHVTLPVDADFGAPREKP
jgi:4-diphosphocytidyl-2-C-methyl-D-erythritol kinase